MRVAGLEAKTAQRKPIALALSEVHRILGKTVSEEGITAATVENVLVALGCGLQNDRCVAGRRALASDAAELAARP